MRAVAALVALVLSACSPPAPGEQAVAAASPSCESIEFTGALTPAECELQAGNHTLAVTYQTLPEGVVAGTVSAEVRDADGAVVQTMLETDVAEYRAPHVQDIDGDGVVDVIMVRAGGMPNAEMGLWVFNAERGQFERIGDVTAVAVDRTESGLIMAPARSSAVEWEVAFYRIDEGGLHPYASAVVEAPAGRSTEPGCRFNTAPPRQAGDDISTVSARHAELCAAAVRVFE